MLMSSYVYDGKTSKGQTRYLVGYMYMTGGQGRYVPDAGCRTKVQGTGKQIPEREPVSLVEPV